MFKLIRRSIYRIRHFFYTKIVKLQVAQVVRNVAKNELAILYYGGKVMRIYGYRELPNWIYGKKRLWKD